MPLASALCGLSPDIGVLIGARALQGIGGALLTPGSLAIIQATFVADDRPRAIGAWSGLGGVAAAVGPLLGGWLIGSVGWRWIFLINLPLAAVVVAVATRHVPETRDPTATAGSTWPAPSWPRSRWPGSPTRSSRPRARRRPARRWPGPRGSSPASRFVLLERRRGRTGRGAPPMLPLDVFASRQFTAVNVVTFVVYGALGGVIFLLVLELQVVSGYSPLAAGVSLLPTTLLMLLLSARAGRWRSASARAG